MVATCLPGPVEMEQVCLGPDGIVSAINTDGLYIDHTTNSPLLVRRVYDILAARGVAMLDAPVSGGMGRRTDARPAGHGGRRAGRLRTDLARFLRGAVR